MAWKPFEVNFSGDFTAEEILSLEDQDVELRFYGEHDGDRWGTWFYVDDLSFQVCSSWPEPDQDDALGTIGGRVRVNASLRANVPVWAQSHAGGEPLRTTSLGEEDLLPKGSYRFYNVTPGKYTVYSEIWEEGGLYWDAETVEVAPGADINVNMDLRG